MCKSKHSIETIFCEILEEKFGIERSVAKDNLTHSSIYDLRTNF